MTHKNIFKTALRINKKPAVIPVSLRTRKQEIAYAEAKKAGKSKALIDEPRLKEWRYWALIENAFPYDHAFRVNHMLIPKRVAREEELNETERTELQQIINELDDQYDCRMVNTTRKQSKLSHFHIHYLTYKNKREDISG